jgi:hypothetical protein
MMVPENSDEPSSGEYQYPLLLKRVNPLQMFFLKRGVPIDQLYRLDIFVCAKSPESHVGPFVNTIDFLVPQGAPVLAARDGIITRVKEDSHKWGNDERFRQYLNYIDVFHDDGEFSQYCHIMAGSVSKLSLGLGDRVKAGQMIGKVGRSGWMDRDHLHFGVFRNIPQDPGFKSLRIMFKR